MKQKTIALLTILLIFTSINYSHADPKLPRKCSKKVLLPGSKKAVKCRKARKRKNAYF